MVRTRFEGGPDDLRLYRVADDKDRHKGAGIISDRTNIADELDSVRRGQAILGDDNMAGRTERGPDRLFRRFDDLDTGGAKIQQQLSKGIAPLRIVVHTKNLKLV